MTNQNMTRGRRGLRGAAASIAAVAALSGLAACSDSEGPEEGVTTSDLQGLQDDIGALEDRVTVVEDGMDSGTGAGEVVEDDNVYDYNTFYEESDSLLNETVTVSAEVSELWTDGGSAIRIGGDSGEGIPVISANPSATLGMNDVVQVTGMVTQIQRDTFEEDFGVAADDVFDDADGFFSDWEGEIALAAQNIQVIDEAADE